MRRFFLDIVGNGWLSDDVADCIWTSSYAQRCMYSTLLPLSPRAKLITDLQPYPIAIQELAYNFASGEWGIVAKLR